MSPELRVLTCVRGAKRFLIQVSTLLSWSKVTGERLDSPYDLALAS